MWPPRSWILVLLALIPASCAHSADPAPEPPASIPLQPLDASVDPCVDFYQHACGDWIATHPIPPDQSRISRFDEVRDRVSVVLREILEAARAEDPARDPEQQRLGDFYAACLDVAAIEARGAEPLAPELRRIDAATAGEGLDDEIARLHTLGADAFFHTTSEQDPKHATQIIAALDEGASGLPDRGSYTGEDDASRAIRRQYLEHIQRMLVLLGEPRPQASSDASAILAIETALAEASPGGVARRDPANLYHPRTIDELAALAPGVAWRRYFTRLGAPPFDRLDARVPALLAEASHLLQTQPLAALRAYLRWRLVEAMAVFLSSDFVNEELAFHGAALRGIRELPSRADRCVAFSDEYLGDALGRRYVERAFGAGAKERTSRMVTAIEAAMRDDLTGLTWMTAPTRARALEKLAAVANKIGYPARWRDDSGYVVSRSDLAGNAARGEAFALHRALAKIGRPVDRTEWTMSAPTVNASYDPLLNSITFPAGILQPPFYDAGASAPVNLGAIGAIIGHELTHGFDDEGRKYDAEGNLVDWWTPADAAELDRRAACFVDEYGAFTAVDGVRLDGRLELGEDIADNGGLRLALLALSNERGVERAALDGWTPEQRLFLSWGQIWCESVRPEAARVRAATDPHAPGRYRVNGVVANMPEFERAFGCEAGQPMVRENACRVW